MREVGSVDIVERDKRGEKKEEGERWDRREISFRL